MRLKPLMYGTVAATVLSLVAGAAVAQEAAVSAEESAVVDEIVVTANKRAENVQDVPLAITVLTDEMLERSGVREFTDLTKAAPSLTIGKTTQPANNSISLRGIGTFAFSIGVEPSVSVVVDGVPLAFQAAAFTDMLDVERVEVLRGPQSTLYGKNASAGLIAVTTKAPTSEFTAKAEAMATTDDEQRFAATIAGPITDTLGARLTASTSHYDGNVRNLTDGEMYNGRDDQSYRGRLQWAPIDDLEVNLTAHYNRTESDCCVGALVELSPTALFYNLPAFPVSVAAAGINIGPDNTDIRADVAPRGDSQDYGGALQADYAVGDHTLTAIVSFDRYKLLDDQDVDGSALDLYAVTNPPLHGGPRAFGEFNVESWTQEMRLTSPGDRPFRYILGYFHGDNFIDRYFFRGPQIVTGEYFTTVSSKSNAVFADATWDILDQFSVLGGVRYNNEDIAYTYDNIFNTTDAPYADAHSDSVVTGRVGAQYRPNDDWMFFLTGSTGYKGQAYDLTSSFNAAIAALQPVKAETSENVEAGFKSSLFDRRMTFNLTAFNTDFENFQAQSREPSIGGAFILSNVGKVRTRGVEVDSSARFGDLRLNGGLAYVDATIVDFPDAQCFPQQTAATGCVGGQQNLSGKRLNNAPEWKLNLGGDYFIPLNDLPFDGFVSATYTWQSEVNFTLTQDPDAVQEAYGLMNLAGGVEMKDGRAKLTVFVNNLFDQHYAQNKQDNSNYWLRGGQPGNAVVRTPGRDFSRYFGVRLSVSY